jgi:hypothetical protein
MIDNSTPRDLRVSHNAYLTADAFGHIFARKPANSKSSQPEESLRLQALTSPTQPLIAARLLAAPAA